MPSELASIREIFSEVANWADNLLDALNYLHNRLRLAFAHLSPPRIAAVVGALQGHKAFGEAMALVLDSDITARRRDLLARRKHTDDDYFERFAMSW